jgi:hypothetical protein
VGFAGCAHALLRLGLIGAAGLLGGCAWGGPQSTLVARGLRARYPSRLRDHHVDLHRDRGGRDRGARLVLLRYRARLDSGLPPQIRGHALLELSWTIAPAIVLLVIAIPTIAVVFRTQAAPARGALEVIVRGQQWW